MKVETAKPNPETTLMVNNTDLRKFIDHPPRRFQDDCVKAHVWLTPAEANDEDVRAAKKIIERVLTEKDNIESQKET
jgi:hypothetical protein